jgi:hypothetical protein
VVSAGDAGGGAGDLCVLSGEDLSSDSRGLIFGLSDSSFIN